MIVHIQYLLQIIQLWQNRTYCTSNKVHYCILYLILYYKYLYYSYLCVLLLNTKAQFPTLIQLLPHDTPTAISTNITSVKIVNSFNIPYGFKIDKLKNTTKY